ncbi:MAG TPA: FHA domain-containing protein [Nitrospirota bacterium]|nr:FHA domain-containing protein [Nitrospirota bacterium]
MKCKECDMENIDGALFCEECGAKLDMMEPLQDTAVETGNGSQLVLTSRDGSKLDIPAKDEVVIGRDDPVSEVFPDLDLTDLGGMDSGVSRKHAIIHRTGAEYTIEDLESTNGTYVNKKRIQPHVPQAIKAGDELRFGKLALAVQAA